MALWRIDINKKGFDPEARAFEADARDMGLKSISPVRITRVWFLEGKLTKSDVEKIAWELLCDPVVEEWRVEVLEDGVLKGGEETLVLYNPGVMDPTVATALRALDDMGYKEVQVRTGRGYRLGREVTAEERAVLSRGLLFNPLIQHLASSGEKVFAQPKPYRFKPVIVNLRGKSDRELAEISRSRLLALSVEEMKILRRFYEKMGRDPSDVELETFAQTWSEHCQHKTFRGEILFGRRRIKNLLKSTVMRVTEELALPWVLSAFEDNSGVIEFDENYGISFKVETHNHPSALEPYGGAATGIGGVIRDCLGTGLGAKPILNTDVFCFGYPGTSFNELPKGVLHPRRVMKGVVAGVRDYGNRMGIPTANGAVYFDPGYLGNPLVFCGTVGLIPRQKLRKKVDAGQMIVLLGGRTGRDGIHGVTFASLELDERSGEFSSGAVQIGNPIEEKKLLDLVLTARDKGLFAAITDCGGGGLSSAVGEMAAQTGCEVWLDKVPLKYPGLSPAEIWVSEAQERMVVFVEPGKVLELLQLAKENDVEATIIGKVTKTKRLVLKYRERIVADLPMRFLHHGWRQVKRVARWERQDIPEPFVPHRRELTEILLKLLATPNIASKEWVTRQYDHEVQAGTVLKPFSGQESNGPTDACVIVPVKGSNRACVVSCGLCPRFGLVDPYWMAASAIDEALRNCVAAGGDITRTAILDNFCWGSPEKEEQLGGLVRAAEGCYDTARGFRVPFISGKDSLYNEFKTEQGETLPIPGTLLISAISVIPDVRKTTTPDFKKSGSYVYLVGDTFPELGGSEFMRLHGGIGRDVPKVEPYRARRLMQKMFQAIQRGLVLACHDLSEGGLGVALSEMSFSGGVGVEVHLRAVPGAHRFERDDFLLFSESNSRFICEVAPQKRDVFERLFAGLPCAQIGRTVAGQLITIFGLDGSAVVRLSLIEACKVWRTALTKRIAE
ncbi:MAG: phosphoribosylformylglycinamidine synthase subunit PurL [candidate division WOR-3 bacterium]|jgi:phosphoribosylformylglycinamidine synthase|nr:phosphoribosylformylglycinamidine synthase subunit PurL [candidate division WOR-3 bacterium]MCR4424416.1 phosphoribosylformylglycinamidine synthase subunit PurL [candidate division WOR-3 bacterium]MDH7518234.1 phosphoribosylformylglycinamidine synthase subunit PurL [bacterium]